MVSTPVPDTLTVTRLECRDPLWSGGTIRLRYAALAGETVAVEFTEVIELPAGLDHVPAATLDPILRLLSLAASLSYFKAFAPAAVAVPSGLTPRERHFLADVTRHGLGEFAYVNRIPEVFETVIEAPELPEQAAEQASEPGEPRRALVAVGGGKDSIVSIEALTAAGLDVGLFAVNSYTPISRTAEVADIPLTSARRTLDPALFALNEAGAPNGHVPVTAVNSLIAVLTALACRFDTVVFSNEASSSFGNVDWEGQQINHQWSKGIEFERLLRESLPAGAPQYVSLLRPLTELRIARRFAEHRAYHRVFTSCNRAFKLRESDRTSWCADCPKCRFVFLCLAPFLEREALLDIFGGRDMFADPAQHGGFLELLELDGLHKPFECVGEPAECRVALGLLREHPGWRDHPFLALPQIAAVPVDPAEREEAFAFREHEHFLTPSLEAVARAV
ncbi:MAG: hypothetical protein QM597_10120 [Aeromicrobium sp.]|uniref:hypothetical protein n=1 Tax=Aeromicrobium sp. TaxID=1871063 RepID=UPI0039E71F89